MSDNDNSGWVEEAGETVDPPQPEPEQAEANDHPDDQEPTGDRGELIAENRRYRQRAQSAETERDELATRLDTAQRSQVAAFAGDLAEPLDVLNPAVGGVELAAVLDDAGQVDPDKVRTAVAEVIDARPGLASHTYSTAPFSNVGQFQGRRPAPRQKSSWVKVIRGE
ncbi:hypothetical protein ACFVHA_28555 [Bacillus cereus]|uniref:hypothetical protein n=1 Tax=Bacillus cereus TaxID=1396 RepID=UPI003641581F